MKKRFIVLTLIGAVIEFLVVLFTGIFGITHVVSGLKNAINEYGQVLSLQSLGMVGLVCFVFLVFDCFLFLANLILSFVRRRPFLALTSLGLFLAIAFLPFLGLLMFQGVRGGYLTSASLAVLAILSACNVVSVLLLANPLLGLYSNKQPEMQSSASAPIKGMSELEIRALVEDYITLHEENMHKGESAVAPVESAEEPEEEEPVEEEPVEEAPSEEPVEEEPEEEEELDEEDEGEDEEGSEEDGEEFEEVEVVNEKGETVKIKRRRRASFETKLKRSVFDLRHKYYDLRDYIKWYGLNNRISIPGDSFSYKRRKYAFITIVGKHIKFYIALEPEKYENSPIPVERATAKKFVDIPCVLKIKSDLSYRRAKLLVDDLMKEIGLPKPEGEEPKETQHPEED